MGCCTGWDFLAHSRYARGAPFRRLSQTCIITVGEREKRSEVEKKRGMPRARKQVFPSRVGIIPREKHALENN
jgi:hypothetical protein